MTDVANVNFGMIDQIGNEWSLDNLSLKWMSDWKSTEQLPVRPRLRDKCA